MSQTPMGDFALHVSGAEQIKVTIQIPSIGRIVHYTLSASDAEQIMRRCTTGVSIAERMRNFSVHTNQPDPLWPAGAQAHIGNAVAEGDVFPMLIVKAHGADEASAVNGQVSLDGCDVFWATSVKLGTGPGTFAWPART
jgi:hypothetical protein